MIIEFLVDSGRRAVGIAGIGAYDAFVVVGNHSTREFPSSQWQSVAGVHGAAEGSKRTTELG
ncbi:hypothetical protein MPSD_28410 [Mycobacterium pseudoshottsii JCM 15466]|uniref:Uncharacterized protein n=1 Tax=Mycobacterium pseudoshottsii TaxID=265949 RepID=A0A9N7LR55_9MYCO|nr:hypothetical protein MPSD_28410 [Mycobacterium pseudoshottsii JCM 15466]BDN82566.1 hypothetical protein NJB1907Z4_C27810 [Mycobacterium pseudoshottsii]